MKLQHFPVQSTLLTLREERNPQCNVYAIRLTFKKKSVYACSQYFEIVIMIVLSEGEDNNRIKPLYIFLRGFYQLFLFEMDHVFFVKLH